MRGSLPEMIFRAGGLDLIGKAAVLKTAARKRFGVRVPGPPFRSMRPHQRLHFWRRSKGLTVDHGPMFIRARSVVRATSTGVVLILAALACHPAAPSPASAVSTQGPRLERPEEIIVAPDSSRWLRAASNGYPHYPPPARDAGVEGEVLLAMVIDEHGRVEYPTVSILRATSGDFVHSVCTYLREARFNWDGHAPARALVIMPFVFTLSGVDVRQPLPPSRPDHSGDTLRSLSPAGLAAWIESKPHCY